MQHRREGRRASHGQHGDTSPEEFRNQLHELADWIADFRQNLGALKVAPNEKPGAILAALPAKAPEASEPFETILADIDRLIVPGMVHWSHPMFFGYFGWTTTAPAILGEIVTAPLNVNLSRRNRTGNTGCRLDPAMDGFAPKVWRRRIRHCIGRRHACAGCSA